MLAVALVLFATAAVAAEKEPRLPALTARQRQEYDALGYDPKKVYEAFSKLKQAFARKDFEAFARLVTYPLTINRKGAPALAAKDAQELRQQKDLLFSPALAALVRAQSFQKLALRDEGAMVGEAILISGACSDGGDVPCHYGVVAVTVP
jgi:hypothetical protein